MGKSEKRFSISLICLESLSCSPDRNHYSYFVKDGGQCVFVEAFRLTEVEACHPWFETQVKQEDMRERFQQVGGALRTLLASDAIYEEAVQLQRAEAKDFMTVQRAFEGDLSTFEDKKMPTRLFTYLSADGISKKVTVCSPAAHRITFTPWCLCLGHRTHTIELTHSLGFCVVPNTHLSSNFESLRVKKVGFKTSRKTSGKQLPLLYVDVPVALSCFHLHQEDSPGGQNRCCLAGSFDSTL